MASLTQELGFIHGRREDGIHLSDDGTGARALDDTATLKNVHSFAAVQVEELRRGGACMDAREHFSVSAEPHYPSHPSSEPPDIPSPDSSRPFHPLSLCSFLFLPLASPQVSHIKVRPRHFDLWKRCAHRSAVRPTFEQNSTAIRVA